MDIMSFNPDLNKQAQNVYFQGQRQNNLITNLFQQWHVQRIYLDKKLNFYFYI